ncbi:ABC transporter ATP-binding protein [Terrabacter sp. NPDC000476]|uniref:ABC transporter ATP-binding protein n=1 Tax=Terrabacter sp. NPDC000476 TaxID=3154258 RepID=UPI0033298135
MTEVLQLSNVSYQVKTGRKQSKPILSGITLSLHAGQSIAVMGQSGAGKSTLLALCMGLIAPTSGTVALAGHPLAGLSQAQLAALRGRHLGVVFQAGELINELTPAENVLLPALLNPVSPTSFRPTRRADGHQSGPSGQLSAAAPNRPTRGDAARRAKELLAAMDLHLGDTPTDRLSGGERQRVAVARALINEPDLVLADEPTGSLDGDTRDRVADHLFAIPREQGCGLLVVTHDPDIAARADITVRIGAGTLVAAS